MFDVGVIFHTRLPDRVSSSTQFQYQRSGRPGADLQRLTPLVANQLRIYFGIAKYWPVRSGDSRIGMDFKAIPSKAQIVATNTEPYANIVEFKWGPRDSIFGLGYLRDLWFAEVNNILRDAINSTRVQGSIYREPTRQRILSNLRRIYDIDPAVGVSSQSSRYCRFSRS